MKPHSTLDAASYMHCLGRFAALLFIVPRMVASLQLPSALEVQNQLRTTDAGRSLFDEVERRAKGRGTPHRASTLRLFDATEDYSPRVTFYRDAAAWCPYCQKTWMLLEEKRIPYRVELINMRSYGDKPASFLRRVPGGFLPALELDGQMYTESLDIMVLLDRTFIEPEHRRMLPEQDIEKARELLKLERQLFGSWCGYLFRGGGGLFGGGARQQFEKDLKTVDTALGASSSPFFLGGDQCSLVDLQYASHLERMCASVAYWKGTDIRAAHPNIDAWFRALEALPTYEATRSDYYTHAMDIPPQYGKPSLDDRTFATICDPDSWRFPLAKEDNLQPNWNKPTPALEAAFELARNIDAVADFASRPAGTGKLGQWALGRPDRAKLADPYAPPAQGQPKSDVKDALLLAASLLLNMADTDDPAPTEADGALADLTFQSWDKTRRATAAACCAYLRDRVGVPRDMSYPAARYLRATLNWIIDRLQAP